VTGVTTFATGWLTCTSRGGPGSAAERDTVSARVPVSHCELVHRLDRAEVHDGQPDSSTAAAPSAVQQQQQQQLLLLLMLLLLLLVLLLMLLAAGVVRWRRAARNTQRKSGVPVLGAQPVTDKPVCDRLLDQRQLQPAGHAAQAGSRRQPARTAPLLGHRSQAPGGS
jgi:hypothetical protein